MSRIRPMLGTKAELDKIVYPVYVSPKLDGIRAIVHEDGQLYSRTGKPIPNKCIQKNFQEYSYVFNWLDGELIVGSPTDSNIFQKTTSGVMSINGKPDFTYYVFDYVRPQVEFEDRLKELKEILGPWDCSFIELIPQRLVKTEKELLEFEQEWVSEGYEGIMIRNPKGMYKFGRSTVKEGSLLKLKRFEDAEAEVINYQLLMHHEESHTNDIGYTEYSTRKADLSVDETQLGALIVKDKASEMVFKIGSGFTQDQRIEWAKNPKALIGKLAKYRYFTVGMKDKPRFPTFIGFRSPDDID